MPRLTLRIALAGPGQVGAELLSQFAAAAPALAARGLTLALAGVADSRRLALGEPTLDLEKWRDALETASVPADLAVLSGALIQGSRPAVLIDCTAGEAVPDSYSRLLAAGVSIVTANKCGVAGDVGRWEGMVAAAAAPGGGHLRAEAACGAGLPILSTLADLIATGDEVVRVEGVFSGTLSALFGALCPPPGPRARAAPPPALSAAVRAARDAGFTEPDPRDDLSGVDVARKAVILARAAGVPLSLPDVATESLIPPALADPALAPGAFIDGLAAGGADAAFAARAEAAAAAGSVLRFVGAVDVAAGTASAGIKACPLDHPLAGVAGGDNVFCFETKRYGPSRPLTVRGPGAGAAVTAAGVFGDVLAVARAAGAGV